MTVEPAIDFTATAALAFSWAPAESTTFSRVTDGSQGLHALRTVRRHGERGRFPAEANVVNGRQPSRSTSAKVRPPDSRA